MATQDSIDKIINIRFNYKELVQGWVKANEAIEDNKKILADLKKEYETGQISLSDYKKAQLELKSTTKALTDEQRQYEKEIQNNIKVEKELDGSLNQLRANLNSLIAQYGRLSAAERESASGKALADHIKAQRDAVKEAEAAIGDYRSNVGNYQSAFNGLNASVLQIVRELPSATMGANMFFLAISNNIPMLVDEINKLRAANKLAMKEGKQGVPILKQLGAAVFSWNSLISVGIALLTVYGKDIVSWIGNLFKGREAAMTMAEAQAEVNKQMAESSGSYGDQVAQLRALQLQWNQLGDDLKAKTEFVKNNREAFDKLGVAITTVADADNLFIQNTDAFIEAMNLRAQANAANELATQKYKDALIARQKAEEKIKKGKTEAYATGGSSTAGGLQVSVFHREYTEDEKKEILAEVEALEAEASAFTQLTVARNADAKSILDRAGIKESEKSSKSANDDPYADESGVKKAERMMEGYYARSKQELQKWVDEQREIIRKMGIDVTGDFEKILSQMDKEVSAEFISQYNQKQSEYRNRILNAQATGGDEAAQNETVAILREQLAEFDSYAAAYRAMGDSAIEIDNRRLEMLIRLHDEMNKGAQKEAQSMQMSFQTAGDLAGALAGLAEEAGVGAPVVAVLGMAQAIASMGAALSKAFSTGNIWEGIAASITAIATITSVISQMKSLNSTAAEEGAKYHYARGGLVTGPGTGTSDSIPARLSNGEAVMTARAVVDWGPVLSMMNVSSGGNAIPTRHLPEKSSGMREMEQMLRRVMRGMPNPVVTVRDINNGQRRVKVQDETARYAGRKR